LVRLSWRSLNGLAPSHGNIQWAAEPRSFEGDAGASLFSICAGTVKITVPSIDGREAMFNLLHAGEIFGEIALLDGQPRTADAVAMTDCDLMMIERRDFLNFVHAQPAVIK